MAKSDDQLFEDDMLSTAKLLRVGKRRYVANMAWRSIENPSRATKEARDLAKREKMNLVMVYESLSRQAGLVQAPSNKIKLYTGAYSLAAVLANFLGESWLGVFELDDGNYLLIAVKDGGILPGYDLVGSQQEIRDKAISIRRSHKWAQVYIPAKDELLSEEFSELGAQPATLISLLEQIKHLRAHRLVPVNARLGGLITPSTVAVGGMIIAIAGTGLYYLSVVKPKDDQSSRLLMMENARDLAKRRDVAREEVQRATITPTWLNKPAARDLILNCQQFARSLPVQVVDWPLKAVDCREKAVVGSYERPVGGAPMSFVDEALTEYPIASVRANAATVGFKLNPPPSRGDDQDIESDDVWMSEWVSLFQRLETLEGSGLAQIKITPKPHPNPPPPKASWIKLLGREQAKVPEPWWLTYEWQMTLINIDPILVFDALPQKGVVLVSVDGEYLADKGQMKWSIKGLANTRP